jgi:carboxyl-terminal processing protease
MSNPLKGSVFRIAFAALAATSSVLSTDIGAQSPTAYDRALELASFDTAWQRVRDSYYDASMRGLNWNALRDSLRPRVEHGRSRDDTRSAITTLLSRLGESHFGVLPGEAMDAGAAATSDRAGDAGMDLRFIDSSLVVTRVEAGTPAQALGIRPGWVIEEIDTLRVLDALRATSKISGSARRFALVRLTLNLNGRLAGPAGGTIRLAMRDGANVRRELSVPLRETPGQVVEYGALPPMHVRFESERLTSSSGCVGLIRFNMFMTPVTPQFEDAMSGSRACNGIVLDLRGNLGGLGAMIMGLSGHFFARPETLGTMRLREANMRYVANPVRFSRSGQPLVPYEGRVAIIVDELSASTTEILAAAMQRLGRARVFGGPSAGQALPALLTRLPNGDRLMYVIADFAGPGGARIEGAGVIPDEPTPLSRRSLLAGRDEALEAALRWIESSRHHSRGTR